MIKILYKHARILSWVIIFAVVGLILWLASTAAFQPLFAVLFIAIVLGVIFGLPAWLEPLQYRARARPSFRHKLALGLAVPSSLVFVVSYAHIAATSHYDDTTDTFVDRRLEPPTVRFEPENADQSDRMTTELTLRNLVPLQGICFTGDEAVCDAAAHIEIPWFETLFYCLLAPFAGAVTVYTVRRFTHLPRKKKKRA